MSSTRDHQLLPQTEDGEDEGAEDEEVHIPLDEDTYGAALFSIVEDFHELFGGVDSDERPQSLNLVRLMFINAVLFGNYVLQFGMLYFIKSYVVDVSIEKQTEDLQAVGHGSKKIVHLLVAEHPLFLAVVLILWTFTILIEARKIERFGRSVASMPYASTLHDMIHRDVDEDGAECWEIKGLTRFVYSIIVSVILVPKGIIVLFLFVLGFEWLAATQKPSDLILNALALEFVVNIDEQLYEALLPKCVKDKMARVTLTTLKKKYPDKKVEMMNTIKTEWTAYKRSISYYIVPVLLSAGYIYWMEIELASKLGETASA